MKWLKKLFGKEMMTLTIGQLLPCKCKGKGVVSARYSNVEHISLFAVKCKACNGGTGFDFLNDLEAIKEWNKLNGTN